MAITLLQSTKKIVTATTGSSGLAFGSNLTAGNLVCLAQGHFVTGGSAAVTPIDTLLHTFATMQTDQIIASNTHLQCWYKENCSGGADTVTFDVTGTGSADFTVVISEFSSIVTASALDKTSPGSGNGTAADSGATATTSQADELLWGALAHDGTNRTLTETGSASLVQENEGGTGDMPIAVSYRVVSATGTYNATWTIGTGAVNWVAQITTFKGAAASTDTQEWFSRVSPRRQLFDARNISY